MKASFRDVLFRCSVIFIILLLSASYLRAEPSGISVDEAVKIALEGNHDFKIAELKTRESEERVNAVWGQLMPVLESEASVMRQGAESGFMSLSDGQSDIKFIQMKVGINPGIF